MKRIIKRTLVALFAVLILLAFAGCSRDKGKTTGTDGGAGGGGTADTDFPTKAITLICPYAAGGQSDMQCRTLAEPMGKSLGQPVTVLNVPGAGGSVGAAQAAAEANDGYTLFMCSAGNMTVVPFCTDVPYSIDSFEPIGQTTDTPFVIVVPNDFPADDIAGFIKYAKENPGLNYGTPGANSSQQIFMELFARDAGIEVTHVPYGGGSEVNAALIGGHLQVGCLCTTDVYANLNDGLYKALGCSAPERDSVVPEVPTFKEQGYDITVSCFYGILVPAGTDPAIRAKLESALKDAMESDYVKDAFDSMGIPVKYESADSFGGIMNDTAASFKAVIDDLNS